MCFTHEEKYRYLFTSTHTVDFVCFANWGSDNIIRCSAVYFGNTTREIKIFNTARHTVGAIISAITVDILTPKRSQAWSMPRVKR